MLHLDDRVYLNPTDNEAKSVLKCSFCDENIYEYDEYYCIYGDNFCLDCVNFHFKKIAETE